MRPFQALRIVDHSVEPVCPVKLAGMDYADIALDAAVTNGKRVTASAWPAHPAWLQHFLAVLGTRIEPWRVASATR
ncbi:hypothetical protein KQH60_01165 [Mycetohabitans sp. B8]|uniref:hypothetical protein n=1 Tax=Mycetohabitans sp. B8 TaxID=2841845 RepID=UPI001F18602D|nr:hypothetical protein [Mycetohabitans sp. B8]MCG1041246.1 hypothetical protein [Mycetohabitans sp. B8]